MTTTRPPAVAGRFFPAESNELCEAVNRYLEEAPDYAGLVPKAIVGPHAGYVYSGPVAGSAYATIAERASDIERVVLLGPSHFVPFSGAAASGYRIFGTPLGEVRIDAPAIEKLLEHPHVRTFEDAHAREHSLETHVPFLQRVLDDFVLVPLVFGDASPETVAEILELVWGGPETLIAISTDLSHFLDYETARRRDQTTSEAIVEMRSGDIGPRDACGAIPLRGLMEVARRRGMRAEVIDVRNSGDTAGSRDQVVGYGAYVFGD